MENEFTFSKNYRSLFKAAKEIKNIEQMQSVFDGLCSEVGIDDPASDAAQSAAGKASAENLNARDRRDGGKKL